MAQPVTPHDHIVAMAQRQKDTYAAAKAVREEIHAARQAELDGQVLAELGGLEGAQWPTN